VNFKEDVGEIRDTRMDVLESFLFLSMSGSEYGRMAG